MVLAPLDPLLMTTTSALMTNPPTPAGALGVSLMLAARTGRHDRLIQLLDHLEGLRQISRTQAAVEGQLRPVMTWALAQRSNSMLTLLRGHPVVKDSPWMGGNPDGLSQTEPTAQTC